MSEVQSAVVDFSDRSAKIGLLARLGALTGSWRVEFKPHKPKRSLRANAYYWAAVVPTFQAFMRGHGQFFTDEEVHEFLLQTHSSRMVIDPTTGEALATIGQRSSKMDAAEFAAYVDRCIGWMVDRFDVVVPEPEYAERRAG